MSSPEAAPPPGEADELVLEGRAMATRLTVRLPVAPGTAPERRAAIERAGHEALAVFAEVETACTRFDPDSPLMRANRSPQRPHRVPPVLLAAVAEAKRAYDTTGGRVDPRVLRHLVALGYDRTLPFGREEIRLGTPRARPAPAGGTFRPRLRRATGEVVLGPDPIDLGGIGKGLAVRFATEILVRTTPDFLVDAGGDCFCAGAAPGGGPWLVGIENPDGGDAPLAVLALSGRAVATSSTRLRRWRAGGQTAHHLVDPRTGRPGGAGLAAVSVVGPDPAVAEAWTKALFLAGRRHVAALASRRRLAALWVDEDGRVGNDASLGRYLQWQRT